MSNKNEITNYGEYNFNNVKEIYNFKKVGKNHINQKQYIYVLANLVFIIYVMFFI